MSTNWDGLLTKERKRKKRRLASQHIILGSPNANITWFWNMLQDMFKKNCKTPHGQLVEWRDVDTEAAWFPPCMLRDFRQLLSQHRLPHENRVTNWKAFVVNIEKVKVWHAVLAWTVLSPRSTEYHHLFSV